MEQCMAVSAPLPPLPASPECPSPPPPSPADVEETAAQELPSN